MGCYTGLQLLLTILHGRNERRTYADVAAINRRIVHVDSVPRHGRHYRRPLPHHTFTLRHDVCNAVHACAARLRYSALATAHGTTKDVAIRRPRHHACHARADVSALQRREACAHLQLAVIELRVGRGIAEDKKPAFLREARLNYVIHLPRRDQCLQSMEVHRAELVTHLTGAARSFLRRRAMECEHCL